MVTKTKSRPAKPVAEVVKPAPSLDPNSIIKLMKKLDATAAQDAYEEQKQLRVYSTGCIELDTAIGRIDPIDGNGGVPERSVIEIFGENGVYKSGTLEQLILSVQRRGKFAAVLYTEEPDYDRMERIGIDLKKLVVIDCYKRSGRETQFMLAERRLKDLLAFSADPNVGLIGIDSLKSMTSALQYFEKGDSKKGAERSFEDSEMAVRARMMEKFFDRLKIKKNDHVITVIVNQMPEHIPDPKKMKSRQPGEESRPKTSGGRRKEFECILRIQVTAKPLKSKAPHAGLGGTDQPLEGYYPQYGIRVFYKLWKNKYSQFTGLRRVAANFLYDLQAFDNWSGAVQMATYAGIITRKGNYHYYGKHKWKSKDRCIAAFMSNPKALDKLKKKVVRKSREIFAYRGDEKVKAKYVFSAEAPDSGAKEAVLDEDAA